MTESEAVAILKRMYEAAAPHREQAVAVHLFGIKYSRDLDGFNQSGLARISEQATGKLSWRTELNKARNLGSYVEVVRSPAWL